MVQHDRKEIRVKASAKVWPSAYASGRLVQCRKKGAANYGNSKKEETDLDLSFQHFMEKCWDGYTQKGMKKKSGKMVPNCVPVGSVKEHHQKDENGKVIEHDFDLPPRPEEDVARDFAPSSVEETVIEHHTDGIWRDENGNVVPLEQLSDPLDRQHYIEKRSELSGDGTPSSVEEGAAWTRKAGKNKSGGLNEKGRKSYERENPGSDLKAPSKKKGNKRRASFCARMKGMKKKLTSAKTARDPDSRINKSLRAWNC